MACAHVREALSIGSTEILTKLIDEDTPDKDTLELLLKALDYYRNLIENKEKRLHETFPEFNKTKNQGMKQRN